MGPSSMTGHADRSGNRAETRWIWEARSVNGRGLDLRLRLPDGFDGLDPAIRRAVGARLARGSVTIAVRVSGGTAAQGAVRVNEAALGTALAHLAVVEDRAATVGIALAPPRATDLMGMRGVLETGAEPGGTDPALVSAITAQIPDLVDALVSARRAEGRALAQVVSDQLDRIGTGIVAARRAATERGARAGDILQARIAAVLGAGARIDPERLAQELALIAVKADVTQELDRLDAHVTAARTLLAGDGPMGRKLDFLTQEFNRETSTLCAKSGTPALTAVGLDMKVVVDQMREQVQNVE